MYLNADKNIHIQGWRENNPRFFGGKKNPDFFVCAFLAIIGGVGWKKTPNWAFAKIKSPFFVTGGATGF